MAARVVQCQNELGTVEHGMLKFLVESDGMVWAGVDAQLAEHARAKVVFILGQNAFFLSVFRGDGLAGHFDGTVGAGHLAQSAGNATVLVPFIVWHDKCTTETVEHFQLPSVLRILFRNLLREELAHRCLQSCGKASYPFEQPAEVCILFFHHNLFLFRLYQSLEVQPTGYQYCH